MAPLPVVFLLAYVVVGVAAKPASVASPHEKAAKGKVKECDGAGTSARTRVETHLGLYRDSGEENGNYYNL